MASNDRTIRIDTLTRVEGEGGLFVRLRDGDVETVELRIYEPPRLFEALLRGRPLEDVADITARICGICPVAYQMSAVHALESALDLKISEEVRRLRRLLYCGEWIESHGLHMHLLHAPDFLGYENAIEMANDHPEEVQRGLRLKKHGNQLVDVLGGRAIHPINVAVGGFYRSPRREELRALVPDFEWGLQAAIDATRWVATFDFPQFERPYDFVALSHPDEYAMNEGSVRSSAGPTVPVAEYERVYEERQVPHSTALHSLKNPEGVPYLVGPLARVNLNREQLHPIARRLADELGFSATCGNTFKAIIARGIELVHAYAEALEILTTYAPPKIPRAEYQPRAGAGCAATEAPRGLIFHRYEFDERGRITFAKIVPPTSQNQAQMEDDLRHFLPRVLHEETSRVARQCENLLRNFDPCISCSTHFLKVNITHADA